MLRDRRTAALHASARGLLGFIDARLRPRERLTELAETLEDAAPTSQDVEDYRFLMDRVAGADAEELGKSNGLIDWTLTTQSSSDESLEHALQRWDETKSPAWLVSVLWKMSPEHNGLPQVMRAAATVPRDSPAYPTVAFLRVRLLLAGGDRNEARRLLATLPVAPEAGIHEDTINLFRAARLRVAANLDEVLTNGLRHVVESSEPPRQLLEDDASELLTHRLPLDRLVEAASSRLLPERVRYRVAAAALSRALVLD